MVRRAVAADPQHGDGTPRPRRPEPPGCPTADAKTEIIVAALIHRRTVSPVVVDVPVVVDLNADVGEGFGVWRLGDDAALLDVVTSANVACGFHAGDARTMRRVCELAVAGGVRIGAQVGYRDLAGFGRRRLDVEPTELTAEVIYQVGALDALARVAGDRVRYLKPHGALYTAAAVDPTSADAVVAAADELGALPVLGLPGSALSRAAAEHGVPFVAEAFADRAYTAAGTLVPRSTPGAVVRDADEVVARSLRLVRDGEVRVENGFVLAVSARSLCVHGDTPGAVELAQRVRQAFSEAGITLAPFG